MRWATTTSSRSPASGGSLSTSRERSRGEGGYPQGLRLRPRKFRKLWNPPQSGPGLLPIMDRESVLHRDRSQSADGRSVASSAALGQTMKIRVLGCSGGIGGSLPTTSFLVDEDVLLDAGTGGGDLSLEQPAKIDHTFLSPSHPDHATSLPFLVDTRCSLPRTPRSVYP